MYQPYCRALIALVLLICVSSSYGQATVVVVPLLGDDAECSITACDHSTSTATISCGAMSVVTTCVPILPYKRVFVTKQKTTGYITTYSGLIGRPAADRICQEEAHDAFGHDGAEFKAWLSYESVHARDRVSQSHVYRNMNPNTSEVVANNYADLIDGSIGNHINYHADGQYAAPSEVWTGTWISGLVNTAHCSDWDGYDDPSFGGVGHTEGLDSTGSYNSINWTASAGNTCTNKNPIYCFEE